VPRGSVPLLRRAQLLEMRFYGALQYSLALLLDLHETLSCRNRPQDPVRFKPKEWIRWP
jgi:hypothetical protein